MTEPKKGARKKPLARRPLAYSAIGGIAVAGLVAAIFMAADRSRPSTEADDQARLVQGQAVYDANCAACHGAQLQGQPNWRSRLPSGRLPAPPHDQSGHTWHHSDEVLFGITKAGPAAFMGLDEYESDMPAYEGVLSDDDIRSVVAFIKSRWPPVIRERQARISQ